jgi:hypothetical protein
MANLIGTRVVQPIVPNNSADTYPTHYDEYGKGGYQSVDTLYDRDNIPIDRQKLGMGVFVNATQKLYILISKSETLSDLNWFIFVSSSGTGIIISETEPLNPEIGALWLNSLTNDMSLYIGGSWVLFVYKSTMASDTGDLVLNGGYF